MKKNDENKPRELYFNFGVMYKICLHAVCGSET